MCVFLYLSYVDNFFGFEAKLELHKKKITIKNMINTSSTCVSVHAHEIDESIDRMNL